MKKFWAWFGILLFIAVISFIAVSCIMSSINDVSLLAEWQSWFGIKEATETAMISFVR
ncbi:MAG: hypothetical protein IKC49_03220 [Clostridia bacterium]|nr:hypothetical protein [Clostridia bacterium]